MPLAHIGLALVCVVAWGANFVVIRLGLQDLPPLAFASMRFGLVAALALWLPRPALSARHLLLYGGLWGTVQFGGLFLALHAGLPAGLSSVLAQSQVVFTLLFAAATGRESWQARHGIVVLLTALGIGLLALDPVAPLPPLALGLGLVAAAGWAMGNLVGRTFALAGAPIDTTAFVAWVSVVPALSLLVLSLLLESWQGLATLPLARLPAVAGIVLYQAFVALLLGSLAWNRLLRHHPASRVAPYSLLVPLVGLGLAWLLLGERPGVLQWLGCLLLLLGLVTNVLNRPGRPRTVIPVLTEESR